MLVSRGDPPRLAEHRVRARKATTTGGWKILDRFVVASFCAFNRAKDPSVLRPRSRPQVRRDYPLSLSISISGGKETYQDSPSNGERTGKSPA